MKPLRRGFFAAASGLLIALFALLLAPIAASAESTHRADPTPEGTVIEFTNGEFLMSASRAMPTVGWADAPMPQIYRQYPMNWRIGDPHTLWGRYRFDRAALAPDPLALYLADVRNQLIVYVNGKEVFRNYARDSEQKHVWYRPYLIPLPADLFRPGVNELVVRAHSKESLAITRVLLGPQGAVQDFYRLQYMWRIQLPELANFAMIILGAMSLLMWTVRRNENELLYLAIMSVG